MIEEKSWEEFRESGLFWFINNTLHLFGWSLVMEIKGERVKRVYPARTKFRGFNGDTNKEGYVKVSEYMKKNADELLKESKEKGE